MIYYSLKIFIKKFPPLFKFFTWHKDCLINLSRLKDVLMMIMLFHIWPEKTYKFSTRKLLPCKKNRFSKESKSTIPYELLESKNCNIPKMKEINVIGLGSSFNLNNLKKINGPIFLVSYWSPLKNDEDGNIFLSPEIDPSGFKQKFNPKDKQKNTINFKEIKNNNFTYVISREYILKSLTKNGHKVLNVVVYDADKDGNLSPRNQDVLTPSYLNLYDNDRYMQISVKEKIYKTPLLPPYPNWVPTGSFLPPLCALSFFAEKINVYGWDFYLDSSPEKMNYWQLFFNMYKFKFDTGIFFRKSSAGSVRSRMHFESALVNFYYGYRLSQMPNINMHGYMGQLDKHEKLIKKIERVLFN